MAIDILDWQAINKKEITQNEYDAKTKEEDWYEIDEHVKFSSILCKFLMVKTTDKANMLVQNGIPDDGTDAWRRVVFQYDPQLASQSQSTPKMILSAPRAKDATEAVSRIQKLEELVMTLRA